MKTVIVQCLALTAAARPTIHDLMVNVQAAARAMNDHNFGYVVSVPIKTIWS